MSEQIYRKKNLDRIKTPDNLDQYIKVANRGIWMLIACILCLVSGVLIWIFFGAIRITIDAHAFVENETAVMEVTEEQIGSISPGMEVLIGDTDGTVLKVVSDTKEVVAIISVPDGVYEAEIVTETITPSALIFE